jgi:FixJ family two-component response regulator
VTAEAILRAYRLEHLTRAEQRARAAVLERMSTFAPAERAALVAAGVLEGWTAADVAAVLERRKP